MLRKPYVIFLGDADDDATIKTGFGIRDWCREDVIGQYRLPACTVSLDITDMTPNVAAAQGAGSLLIGVASFGGVIPASWTLALFEAVDAGLDIISGMHDRLANVPGLAARAALRQVKLHDLRHSDQIFPVGSGRKRAGKRLLTVGTDCALGKKYTALTVARALQDSGIDATFRATGQTGIMISGNGVAIDAIVSDFVAGAAEILSPDNHPDHWDIIEGQGSLFHPAYAAVSLGLLHGSQPDAIILCHDPLRSAIMGYPDYPIPALDNAIATNIAAARLTNPNVRCVGIAMNTKNWSDEERFAMMRDVEQELNLPVFDPLRDSLKPLFESIGVAGKVGVAA